MFMHAYETTPCSAYNLGRTISAVQFAQNNAELYRLDDGLEGLFKPNTVRGIWGVSAKNAEIPAFSHPLVVDVGGEEPAIILDLRPHTRLERDGTLRITAKSGLEFAVGRAALQKRWLDHPPADFLSLGDFQVSVYSRWLAENISRRLGLDAGTQIELTVISAFFYLSLFQESETLDLNDRIRLASRIARSTHISAEKAILVVEHLPEIRRAGDYVTALTETLPSVRLRKFNVGLLYSILGGGWFGANAQEILAVAVEHPPTFISLLHTALNDRSYHRSLFSRLVQQLDKRDLGKDFSHNVARLIAA